MEIWKDIIGFEGRYSVSSLGRIKSYKNSKTFKTKILKIQKKRHNYCSVLLYEDGSGKRYLVHRLVMLVFKGKSNLLITHKNKNNIDNRLKNLEYITEEQRIIKIGVSVKQFDLKGNLINIFESNKEASLKTKTGKNGISKCINNKAITAGGFIWKRS